MAGANFRQYLAVLRGIIVICPNPSRPRNSWWAFVVLTLLVAWPSWVGAVRIKDLADINGVRENQLVGYGLVVGLDGTGDGKKSLFTVQSMVSMLEKMGITINPNEIAVSNR